MFTIIVHDTHRGGIKGFIYKNSLFDVIEPERCYKVRKYAQIALKSSSLAEKLIRAGYNIIIEKVMF